MRHNKKLSRWAVMILLSYSLLGCVGDDSSSDSAVADEFDFTEMFANYVDAIFLPNYRAVQTSAEALATDQGPLTQYCAAIGGGDQASLLMQAQSGWRDLQAAIQVSESHVVGPAVENGAVLRSRLNAFSAGDLSTCGIDQAVVLADNDSGFDITARTITQRGIGAVEYLLFNDDLTHTCPSQISETANWDALPEAERRQLRCHYAIELVEDIQDAAESIVNAWDSNGENYRSEFINPNNVAESLSALSDAMFFIEAEVKDVKLGIPLGISDDCTDISCSGEVESLYSENSFENIRKNVEGFATLLTGANGLGFDDIIREAGVDDLNERFLENIDLVLENISAQTDSLWAQATAIDIAEEETACTNAFTNPESSSEWPGCSLYGLIKRITDDLKVGFVAAVDVDLPDRSQTDND